MISTPVPFASLASIACWRGGVAARETRTRHNWNSNRIASPLGTRKGKMPSREELLAAVNWKVADVIDHDLDVLFCGINPGLYTAWAGYHFARPGNRFWPALYDGGFTPRLLQPNENTELLKLRYGITNMVRRATVRADELTKEELQRGGRTLRRKLSRYKPKMLAVLGVTSYRVAFGRPNANVGPQEEQFGQTKVWLLPNPSGLNAHYTRPRLAEVFGELHTAVEALRAGNDA